MIKNIEGKGQFNEGRGGKKPILKKNTLIKH